MHSPRSMYHLGLSMKSFTSCTILSDIPLSKTTEVSGRCRRGKPNGRHSAVIAVYITVLPSCCLRANSLAEEKVKCWLYKIFGYKLEGRQDKAEEKSPSLETTKESKYHVEEIVCLDTMSKSGWLELWAIFHSGVLEVGVLTYLLAGCWKKYLFYCQLL